MSDLCDEALTSSSSSSEFFLAEEQLVVCRHQTADTSKRRPAIGFTEDALGETAFYRGITTSVSPLLVFAFDFGVTNRITLNQIVAQSGYRLWFHVL